MRALLVLVVAGSAGCLDPTEITVEITTTFDCPSLRTGLLVGGPEALGPGPFTATKETCAARRVGELVVVPRKTADAAVYVRVLAGVDGTSLDVCQQDFASRPMGSKCIEAKRIAHFVHHTKLRIPIVLSQSCINVMCGDLTCEDGKCVDPNVCVDPSCMDAGSVPPIDSGAPVTAQAIAVGFDNACALVSEKLECWGSNATLQLGPGFKGDPVTTIPMPNATTIAEIAIGGGHICTSDKTKIVCWGNNSDGQLGNGLSAGSPVAMPTVTKIPNGAWPGPLKNLVAQTFQTCVLAQVNTGQQMFCWGQDGWSFYGGAPVRFTNDPGFVAIAMGRAHSCGIDGNAAVRCWGTNNNGQLGQLSIPGSDVPLAVSGIAKADLVFAGYDHSATEYRNGLGLWGRNADAEVNPIINTGMSLASPQLVTPPAVPIVMGESHVCILDMTNVRCRGSNKDGQLGPMLTQNGGWWDVPIPEAVANIAAGRAHTCALTINGAVYCWGAAPAGPGSNQPKRIVL